MSAPKRIQRPDTEGWTMPEGAVDVDQTPEWRNPWRVVPVWDNHYPWGEAADVIHETDDASIGRFSEFTRMPNTGAPYWAVHAYRHDLTAEFRAVIRRELAGKDLVCTCPLDQPCHADVLLEIANAKADAA